MTLQKKITLLILPLVMLPLGVVGCCLTLKFYSNAKTRLLDEMGNDLEIFAKTIEAEVNTSKADAWLLSTSNILQKYVLLEDEEEKSTLFHQPLLRLFSNYQKRHPHYLEICFLGPDNQKEVSAKQSRVQTIDLELLLPSQALAHKNEETHENSFFALDGETGKATILSTIKIFKGDRSLRDDNSNTSYRGTLAVVVDISPTTETLSRNSIGQGGGIFLCDNNGIIISHPDPGLLGQRFPLENLPRDEAMELSANGFTGYFQARALSGGGLLIGYVPKQDILRTSIEVNLVIGVVMACAVAAACLLLIVSLRAILLEPIKKINRSLSLVGAGDLDVPLDIYSRDELGLLADSFRAMAGNLRQFRNKIAHMAKHDCLTNLPNRRSMDEILAASLDELHDSGGTAAVLFIDMDDLKQVNDTMGHGAGDELLRQASVRMRESLRTSDVAAPPAGGSRLEASLARLGGDEFLALVPNVPTRQQVERLADRLLRRLCSPYALSGKSIYASASIGISRFPTDAATTKDLVIKADQALYAAKRSGKNRFLFYNTELQKEIELQQKIQINLPNAIEEDKILVYYQPIVNLKSGKTVGHEALARWFDPELGWISPGVFIPLAEQCGLILPLTAKIAGQACRQCAHWIANGQADLYMSLNISSSLISSEDVVSLVEKALLTSGLEPKHLNIELTENTFLAWGNNTARNLASLRKLGVKISIDDFGKEYSCLSYLTRVIVNCIKIDKSFIDEVPNAHASVLIVKAIIDLAHELGISVVGEGVEHSSQYEFLKEAGCDHVQGFLLGRPEPPGQKRAPCDSPPPRRTALHP